MVDNNTQKVRSSSVSSRAYDIYFEILQTKLRLAMAMAEKEIKEKMNSNTFLNKQNVDHPRHMHYL